MSFANTTISNAFFAAILADARVVRPLLILDLFLSLLLSLTLLLVGIRLLVLSLLLIG